MGIEDWAFSKKFFAVLFLFSVFGYFLLSAQGYAYVAAAMPHFAIFSIAMFFIYEKGKTLARLGIPGNIRRSIGYTAGGLVAIIGVLILVNILANTVFSLQKDAEKVAGLVEKLPTYVLLFAVFFAPVSEELFFRALLTQRFGIVLPAALFGILHITYGSVLEVLSAFLIGLVLGYVYKKATSILPCMAIHLIYNALAILAIKIL